MARSGFEIRVPDIRRQVAADQRRFRQDQERLARVAMDRVSKKHRDLIQQKMIGAGLGKLANAVKQTSALRKGRAGAWGVTYAAGGDESRAGQALDAYSNGVTITARNRQWLAFVTNAIPALGKDQNGRRARMTPALYNSRGYASIYGKLIFRPVSARLALLVVRNTTVHVRTGRVKPPGKRRSNVRTPEKEVAVFVLIRFTRRGKRFDKDELAAVALAGLEEIVSQIDRVPVTT